MTSSSVTEFMCSQTQPWTFLVAPAPASLPVGNYTIQFNGQCLIVDASGNVTTTSSGCSSSAVWYYTTEMYQGQTYYFLNYIPNGLETPGGNIQAIYPDPNSAQLMYSTDSSSATALPVQLSTDNSIYNNIDTYRYTPDTSTPPKIVEVDPSNPDQYKWTFTNVACPTPPTVQSTGLYAISFKDGSGTVQYLSYNLKDPSSGKPLMIYTPQFSLATCGWQYDATAKTLATGCISGSTYYLYFDPAEAFHAWLTTTASSAADNVTLTNNGVMVSNFESLIPSKASSYIKVYSCLSAAATQWTVTSLSAAIPASIKSEQYIINYGKQCLLVDTSGNGVVLDTCPTTGTTVWNYDSDKKTLSTGGKCLINPSSGCSTLANLSLGDCSDPNAGRFVLGTNGQLFDPVMGFCYTPPISSIDINNRASSPSTLTSSSLLPYCGLLIVLIVLVVIIVLIRRSKT